MFNLDSTDHVIHTWALCGPGGLNVVTEAKRVRPTVFDHTHPIAFICGNVYTIRNAHSPL